MIFNEVKSNTYWDIFPADFMSLPENKRARLIYSIHQLRHSGGNGQVNHTFLSGAPNSHASIHTRGFISATRTLSNRPSARLHIGSSFH